MKLITWNCQGAFRKKADYIISHKPDILIVPESEHPDKLGFGTLTQKPKDYYWHGDSPRFG